MVFSRRKMKQILFVCAGLIFVICIYKTFVTSESIHVPQPRSIEEGQQFDNDNELDNKYSELEQTKLKLKELELKIQVLEDRIPKKYPDVTYLNYKNRKRILITGGAGFVGSHLTDYLMMQGGAGKPVTT